MDEKCHSLQKNSELKGRYIIEKVLGQGGDYIAYLGVDKLYEKKVVIKELFPISSATRNIEHGDVVNFGEEEGNYNQGKEIFLNEACSTARFDKTEAVAKALDFFEINNTAYIVKDYLEGITLSQYLRENGTIEPKELVEFLIPLLQSLDEMHSQGIIHCDICPDNIMVLLGGKVKLIGFGAEEDYKKSRSISCVLHPQYVPLEQYRGNGKGPWTDIYALCATVYRCITGKTPPDVLQRIQEQSSLKKISDLGIPISPQLETAIMKGMSISVEERYHSIQELCEDLYKGY